MPRIGQRIYGRRVYFSCTQFTVKLSVDEKGIIREAAPLVQRFVGQPLHSLHRWAYKQGWGRITVVFLPTSKGTK